jgi:hypothetical protein
MRQENTHRVILNTIILAAMEFQEKPAASSAQLLFTAFEGEKEPKPVNMLLKVGLHKSPPIWVFLMLTIYRCQKQMLDFSVRKLNRFSVSFPHESGLNDHNVLPSYQVNPIFYVLEIH